MEKMLKMDMMSMGGLVVGTKIYLEDKYMQERVVTEMLLVRTDYSKGLLMPVAVQQYLNQFKFVDFDFYTTDTKAVVRDERVDVRLVQYKDIKEPAVESIKERRSKLMAALRMLDDEESKDE